MASAVCQAYTQQIWWSRVRVLMADTFNLVDSSAGKHDWMAPAFVAYLGSQLSRGRHLPRAIATSDVQKPVSAQATLCHVNLCIVPLCFHAFSYSLAVDFRWRAANQISSTCIFVPDNINESDTWFVSRNLDLQLGLVMHLHIQFWHPIKLELEHRSVAGSAHTNATEKKSRKVKYTRLGVHYALATH